MVNKSELVSKIAEVSELTKKDAEKALNAFIEVVTNTEEDIKIVGFGNFELREKEAYVGRNPKTGDPVDVPASVSIKFKPSKTLKRIKE